MFVFFFKQKTAYELRISDGSSDVCSSDLTPEVLADSVADAALLLVLGAARRATESIRLIRSGAWAGWTPTQLNGVELRGKTLGILGMGGIGQRIGERSRAFGKIGRGSCRERVCQYV